MAQALNWPWPEDAGGRVSLIGTWTLTLGTTTHRAGDLGGTMTATCLARLCAAEGGLLARDVIADAVWGEQRPASWQSSLRNMLTALRRRLGDDAGVHWEGGRAGVALRVEGGLVSDLDLLARHRADAEALRRQGNTRGALESVTRLLRSSTGTVGSGLAGPWVAEIRREVEEHRVRLAQLGAELALREGDATLGVELARTAVALRPAEETGHQLLMRGLHAAGDRAAALAVHADLRVMLREQFGSEPSQATDEVFLDLLRHAEGGAVRDRRRLLPFATGRLRLFDTAHPFVGRDTELAELAAHLLATRGITPVALVSGPMGIGKTRLAAALAGRAHVRGAMVLHGRADSRFAVPYATVAEALDTHLGLLRPAEVADLAGRHAAVLGRYLPSCRQVADPAEATGIPRLERVHAETAFLDLLERLVDDGPVLLVLDDLQWGSIGTVRLLEALLTRRPVPGLAVLALQRDDGGTLEGLDSPALLRTTLGPLDRDAVRALREQVDAGGLVDPGATGVPAALDDALWVLGGGHPLVTTTLLRGRHDDVLRLSRPQNWAPVTRELLPALPAEITTVMRTAAASRRPLDAETLSRASGVRTGVVSAVLAGAATLGLLVDADEPGRRLLHPAVEQGVLAGLAADDLAALRRRLADLGDPAPTGAPAATAAAAPPASAVWRRAVRAAVPAMRSAIDRGEYATAVATGLEAFHRLEQAGDPDADARRQLQILLGEAWRAQGDERAHATLHDVVAEARAEGDVVTMAEAALAFTVTGTGTDEAHLSDALLDLYEEVLAALGESEPALRARLLGHLGTAYGWRNSADRAAAATTAAIELAEGLGDPDTLISVYTTGRRALAGSGMVDHQEFFEARLLQLTADYNDPPTRVRTAIWRFESRVQRGEGAELETLLDPDPTALRTVRDTGSRHSLLYSRAALHLLRGDLDAADVAMEEAARVGRENSSAASIVEAIRLIQLMLLRWEQGRLAEVRNELAAFCAAHDVPEWWGSMAFADAVLGLDAEIPRELDLFFGGFDRAGARIAIPHGLAALMATPLERLGQVERARWLYEVLLPAAGAGGYVGCFSGPIDHSLGVLARTWGDTDTARRHFLAGAEFSRRLGAPLWLARCEDAAASI